MKRSLEHDDALPVLPVEVIELIFAATPLDSVYRHLAVLRQVYGQLPGRCHQSASSLLRRHTVALIERFIARVDVHIQRRVALAINDRMALGLCPNEEYFRLAFQVTLLPNVWDNDRLLVELRRIVVDGDDEHLWRLLTRIELGEAWRVVHGNRSVPSWQYLTSQRDFALSDASALLEYVRAKSDGCISPQLHYHWWDAATGNTRTAPLARHSGLRRCTNLSSATMDRFVKSYGAADRPPAVKRLAHLSALNATKISLYYEMVGQLCADASDRHAQFAPHLEEAHDKQLVRDTVICMDGGQYHHIYSDTPEVKAFRATLFYATVDEDKVTRLYCLYRAIRAMCINTK
jgi:hypothetical protein